MNGWGELVVGSLLWVGIIAGLISVVRDCMNDQRVELIFPDREEEDCPGCCGLSSLEILPRRRQEP